MSQRELFQTETIAEIGAEGGSLVIEGVRDAVGAWQFRVSTNESLLWDLLGEEPPASETPPWGSWEQAIARLNSFSRWPRLHPLQLHDEFAEPIFRIIASHEEGGPEQVARWRKLLKRPFGSVHQ